MSSAQDKFPITAAQLVGNFCETLLYGIYLVTCCLCARTLFLTGSGREERWLRPHEIRWMMVFVAGLLLAICSFDVAIGLLHNFQAFIQSSDAFKEYYDIEDWINIARSVDQVIAMILGDFVLIYRCWVVHGHRWLIMVPSLILYLAGISMAIRLIQVEADPGTSRASSVVSDQIRPWLLAFFSITAVQNALTTCIIIWRIWRVDSRSTRYLPSGASVNQPRYLRKVMRVIAESGAVYTLMVFLTFVICITGSLALYPMSDMTLQATGIAFNVILIRSPVRRDKQFSAYDIKNRPDHHTMENMTVRSVNYSRDQHWSQHLEVETSANNSRIRSDSLISDDAHSEGIIVTKTVLTA